MWMLWGRCRGSKPITGNVGSNENVAEVPCVSTMRFWELRRTPLIRRSGGRFEGWLSSTTPMSTKTPMPKIASRRSMRRIKPCWQSPSLAVRRQSENSHATCVRAWERLLPTGRRFLAESPCDALSVLGQEGTRHPPEGSITHLSTASVRTAIVDGRNGRVVADLASLVLEPSLPRRRSCSANIQRDRVSLKGPVIAKTHHKLRRNQPSGDAINGAGHRNILNVQAKMPNHLPRVRHRNVVRRRPLKVHSPMLGTPLGLVHLLLLHLLRGILPIPKVEVAVLGGSLQLLHSQSLSLRL